MASADRPGARPCRPAGARRFAGSAGMTLIEVLVTLALVAMITTVLAQAMSQIRRIEGLLASGQLEAQSRMLRLEWLRAALQAALPMPADLPGRFQGDATTLTFTSTQAPGPDSALVSRMRVDIRHDGASGTSRLEVSNIKDDGVPTKWVAADWSGHSGRLRYMDSLGQWQDVWPLPAQPHPALPAAVMIDPGSDEAPPVLAAMALSPIVPPLRRDLESP